MGSARLGALGERTPDENLREGVVPSATACCRVIPPYNVIRSPFDARLFLSHQNEDNDFLDSATVELVDDITCEYELEFSSFDALTLLFARLCDLLLIRLLIYAFLKKLINALCVFSMRNY